jgi:two-component system, OmpR family, response regulator BaeR
LTEQSVLIVEDEQKIAGVVRDYLERFGFKTSWLDQGDKVISCIKEKKPDLILLDIMLPGMDGIEICKEIRKFSQIPIIMMTARIEEVDRLIGFELGADDYICKPFSPRELVARVKAVLKRSQFIPQGEELVLGPVRVNESTRQVSINDQEIKLTPNEYGLLVVMIRHPGHVFTRNELLNQVQGYRYEGYDRTVDSHVKNLRKKIARIFPDLDIISSVYGVGYRLNPL